MKPSRLALRAALPLAFTLYAACGGGDTESASVAETADTAGLAPESTVVAGGKLATCEEKTLTSATKTIPETEDYVELTGAGVREVRVTYHAHPGGGTHDAEVEAVAGKAGDVEAKGKEGRRMTIAIDTIGCTQGGTFHIYWVTGGALHELTDVTAPKSSMIAGTFDPGSRTAQGEPAPFERPRFAVGTE